MTLFSLRRPHQIFSDPLPPPPPPPPHAQLPLNQTYTSCTSKWINGYLEPKKHQLSLDAALPRLEDALRLCFRRKLLWPAQEFMSPQLSPKDYLEAVLKPIVDIFNQLHSPKRNVLVTPMEVYSLNSDEPVCAYSFQAEDFVHSATSPPIVLFVPGDLFTLNGTVTPATEDALSGVLKHTPKVHCIVATDLMEIAVFTPAWGEFERLETTQFTLALRVISTALVFNFMPRTQLIQYPHIEPIGVTREGPPQNPDQPLLSDQEVFDSCKRLADFDLVTLPHYPAWAHQFFRWCRYVQETKAPIAQSGDVLTAMTNNIGAFFPENARPLFPFDPSELPMDTNAHLKAIQRESPLTFADIGKCLEKSRNFMIEILETIAENRTHGMGSVYLCQITSIDGQSVSSPALCLKLFDDRFRQPRIPKEGSYYLDYFACLQDAPSLALNEAQIYDKLRPVQGSIIPWFYGIHQFTLPDGLIIPGLIMEYIRGSRVDSDHVRASSTERQIQMIRSCRHACRVLDTADIAQCDWHRGQILFYTNPETQLDHIVFIDFALAVQTWELENMYIIQNYDDLFYILKARGGIDGKLVDEHFGAPDDWDVSEVRTSDDKEIKARDMFPYISLCYAP